MKKLAMFAAGVLFGTAGIKLLSSKDAKKAYTHTTAAVLRAKDSVMKTVTTARENVEDIYSDARPSTSSAPRTRPPPLWRTLPRKKPPLNNHEMHNSP